MRYTAFVPELSLLKMREDQRHPDTLRGQKIK